MEQERKSRIKHYFRILSWSICALIGIVLLWGGFVEPNMLCVRRCDVTLPGLPDSFRGARAIIIADTHFGNTFIDRLRKARILRYFKKEKPDLCLLLGDYIAVGSIPEYGSMPEKELTSFFSGLKAPWGTYAVLGNHELWYGRSRMTKILEKTGVLMVENRLVKVKGLDIAGVPDASVVPFDRKKYNSLLRGEGSLLLLSHKGGMLRQIDSSREVLMLSADTHGGQIRIPGIGSLKDFLSRRKEFPPGLSERWGKKLFITAGAGGHRLGFRLFCPPEIAVVTFKKEGKSAI